MCVCVKSLARHEGVAGEGLEEEEEEVLQKEED